MLRWLLGLALPLAATAGFLPPPASDPAVKVMSFNLRYATAPDGANHWVKRRDLLFATITNYGPDLLGTQETLALQRDWLRERLPGYEVWAAGRDDGQDRGEMAALFYRKERFEKVAGGHFWLSPTPDQVGSRGWDAALPRVATWVKLRDRQRPNTSPVLFLNTHFDHRGASARLESARLLRAQLATLGKDCALIITGDFNTAEGSPPYAALFDPTLQPLLRDTFRVFQPQKGADEGTFNGFKPAATTGPRIDWIGCSADWQVTRAAIDRTAKDGHTPSDHFPVTATLVPRQP